MTEGSERLDCGFPEIEGCDRLLNVNLSHIRGEQRYLKVTPSDNDDSMKLKTINGKEYFVKLKELEINKDGEFVMTLRPSRSGAFQSQIAAPSYGDLFLSPSEQLAFIEGHNQQTQEATRGFVKIDTTLSNIFNNIKCNKV